MGITRSLKDRAIGATVFMTVLGAIPFLFAIMIAFEHNRRLNVLSSGERVVASVTRSDANGYKKLCMVRYVFVIRTKSYNGEVVGCDLMHRYPVGSALPVRYALDDPGQPLAQEETTWPAYDVVPIFLLIPWSLVAGIIGTSLIKEALAHRRKRIRRRNGNVS